MARLLVALAVLLALAPAADSAKGAAAPTRDEAVQAGKDAYLYGFPLIDFLRIRRENTSVKAPDERGNAPRNFFSHAPAFAGPEDRTVVAPNVDTLYSIAQVDLGKGPIVLSHPRWASATSCSSWSIRTRMWSATWARARRARRRAASR